MDQEFRDVLISYEENNKNLRESCKQKLIRFFRRCLRDDGIGRNLFRGTFFPHLRFKSLTFDQFVAILTEQSFITFQNDGRHGHFILTRERWEDVTRLCEQNIETARLAELVEQIATTIERRL